VSSSRGLEIERDDEMGRFESDDEAVAYVRGRADAGDRQAKSALRQVGLKRWAGEYKAQGGEGGDHE